MIFKRKHRLEEVAKEHMADGRVRAHKLIDHLHGALLIDCIREAELAKHVAEVDDETIIGIELQFLWGFFYEHVLTLPLPTTGADRIKLHLLDWLINCRGYDLSTAVDAANATEARFNRQAPFFDEMADAGRASYFEAESHAFAAILRAMIAQQRPETI